MNIFKIVAVLAWLGLLAITVHAVQVLGADAGMVFFTDFAHPWRAQFNTDFSLHILLLMTWVVYREKSLGIGLLCSLGCLFGALYTIPYLISASIRAGGDVRKLLLGRHA